MWIFFQYERSLKYELPHPDTPKHAPYKHQTWLTVSLMDHLQETRCIVKKKQSYDSIISTKAHYYQTTRLSTLKSYVERLVFDEIKNYYSMP